MRAFLKALILIPLALVFLGFAIANREMTTVSFDPFASDLVAFSIRAPLFLILILTAMLGVVFGGVAAWLVQGKHRRAARLQRDETERLRDELARARIAAAPSTALARVD